MGEAKRRRIGAGGDFQRLDTSLTGYGIDTTQFAFYDQDAFLSREREDPTFLENYARWVVLRPREQSYDAHAREVAPRLSSIISDVFSRDGMEGGCVAASGMISRMFDRLGVWSVGVAGSLTLEVKKHR